MPRNAQGLYTLPAGNPVISGTEIESVWANTTLDDVAAALTASLPRDGSAPMVGPLILSNSTPVNAREATSKAYVDQFIALASGMPVGGVMAYAGTTAPPGWLLCDGSAVSRTTYDVLFAAVGVTYGPGDSSTTFNVPDMRDEFIRGRSASRALGNKQAAAFASHTHTPNDPGHVHAASQAAHNHAVGTNAHTHTINDPTHTHIQAKGLTAGAFGSAPNGGSSLETSNVVTGASATGISINGVGDLGGSTNTVQPAVTVDSGTTGLTLGAAGGDETRPQNIAQDYYIKAVLDASGPATVTDITTSDAQMISVDNTLANAPELVIHSNTAFGTVKLDANGKVPQNLVELSTFQYIGPWDASGGQNPSQALPSEVFSNGDMYQVAVGGTISLRDAAGTSSSTVVVATDQIAFVTGSTVGLPEGWYFQPSTTVSGVTAGAVSFIPTGTIGATNVQTAIAEVAAEAAPLTHVGAGNGAHSNVVAAGAAGFMTGADKTKLDGIAAGAQVNTVGSVNGQTGTVVLTAVDVGALTQSGADSLYVSVGGDVMTGGLTVGGTGITFPDASVQSTAAVGNPPAMKARRTTDYLLSSGVWSNILFETEVLDTGGWYDPATGKFTPQVAGWYQVSAQVGMNGTNISIMGVIIDKNSDTEGFEYRYATPSTGGQSLGVSVLVYLNGTTDYIVCRVTATGTAPKVDGTLFSFLSAFLVRKA